MEYFLTCHFHEKDIKTNKDNINVQGILMKKIQDICLTKDNIREIPCCPGGLEVRGKKFVGELDQVLRWRKKMLEKGMRGFISYHEEIARGFIEYMPVEVAPLPIEAPGSAVLMCYHWVPRGNNEEEHLPQEKRLIELTIEDAKEKFSGIVTLGWNNPVHFPIKMLEEMGFKEVETYDYLSLMWLPFENNMKNPRMIQSKYEPKNLFSEGLLAIDQAYSTRCPYSIHNAERVKKLIEEINDERICYSIHRIDDREEAIKWSISPWNWEWLFFNGDEINLFDKKSKDLKKMILDRIDKLGD